RHEMSNNSNSFESFLEGWQVRQEHYLDELLTVLENCHEFRDDDLRDLIARVLTHYQDYYEEKSKLVNRDVFLAFSPTWFSHFERSFFWIAGFKPGLAIRLGMNSVDDLSEDQIRKMELLKAVIKMEEKTLMEKLAKIQESVAAPPVVELARRAGRKLMNGEAQEVDSVIEMLRMAMEAVLHTADMLRTTATESVVKILNPIQNVKFLAAATQLQLRIRMLGMQREAEQRANNRGGEF
ncbi:unnamed protein product, partial [Ilex paraguariensis]